MSYTINKSIIVNHYIKNSPIGGVAVFIELVEMDGVVRGDRHAMSSPYTRFVIAFFQIHCLNHDLQDFRINRIKD
jgi:hypothetical protein